MQVLRVRDQRKRSQQRRWRTDTQWDNKLRKLNQEQRELQLLKLWILLMGWLSSEHKSDHWIKGIKDKVGGLVKEGPTKVGWTEDLMQWTDRRKWSEEKQNKGSRWSQCEVLGEPMTGFSGAVCNYKQNLTTEFMYNIQPGTASWLAFGEMRPAGHIKQQIRHRRDKLVKEQCPWATKHLGNRGVMTLIYS